MKTELLEGGAFRKVEEVRSEPFSRIEGFYGRTVCHSAPGRIHFYLTISN
ncbi:MAG TPA: hypothetical protein PLP21_14620 [Pyrinomonadaceae bacterium]|nr:hypothetical protein [Acidobacteriota bacterium]HQZ97553.1 hypothetical protein [Pyrinomonadaceae bacterium]